MRHVKYHRGVYASKRAVLVCILSLLIIRAGIAHAISENLSGTIRVDASNGESAGEDLTSLNQQYSLNWSKQITPYLSALAAFSYNRTGFETNQTGATWREQIRPLGELTWAHPYFSLSATASRRESNSTDRTTSLINQNVGVSFRTRPPQYPVLSLRGDWDEIYNDRNRADRDTRKARYQASVSYNGGGHGLLYSFANLDNDVHSSNINLTERTHLFRWDHTMRPITNRLRLTTGYSFNNRRETSTLLGAGTAYRTVPVRTGLYAFDATPDLDALDSLRTLADGNTTNPAFPEINIGQGLTDQNVGVDLGFRQEIEGLYVYTDRPSGSGVTWAVYTSSDNVTWDQLPAMIDVDFNSSFSRYELFFSGASARYVKAVSGGLNDVVTALITEIEAVGEELTDKREVRAQSSHQGNANMSFRFAEQLQSTAEVFYRTEPEGDFSSSRDQLFYGGSIRYAPWRNFTHSVNAQAGSEEYKLTGEEQSNTSFSYVALFTPIETLEFSASASTRRNYVNNVRDFEASSGLFRSSAKVLPKLAVTTEVGFSRTDQPLNNRMFDSWTYQTSTDATLIRQLDVNVAYLYQQNDDVGGSTFRTRRQISGSANLRLSRTIQMRGTASRNDDNKRISTNQEYTGAWRLSEKLTVSATTSILEGTTGITSRRSSILSMYKLNNRTSFSLTYSEIDSGLDAEQGSKSIQVGVRTGF